MEAFRTVLIHDITPKQFADIYAQTIAYGMFAARLHDDTPEDFTRHEAANLIPKSNPFLRKIFQQIAGFDLDERIAWIVDDLVCAFAATDMERIMRSKQVELSVHQTGSDLAYVSVQAGAHFDWSSEKEGHHTPSVGFNGAVLATRQGNDVILFEGTTHEYLPNGDGVTSIMPRTMDESISFTIQRTNAKNAKGEWILEAKNGTIYSRTEDSRSSGYNDVYEGYQPDN